MADPIKPEIKPSSFLLTTDAVGSRGFLDARYTCDLDNSSPELRWENIPSQTQSYALFMEDLNTSPVPFVHWLIYAIPATLMHLPAGIPPQDKLPNGIKQGINSFGKLGYSGPCPPLGEKPHHYRFRLFALNSNPTFPSRIRSTELMSSIIPLILSETSVVATYQRMLQRAG